MDYITRPLYSGPCEIIPILLCITSVNTMPSGAALRLNRGSCNLYSQGHSAARLGSENMEMCVLPYPGQPGYSFSYVKASLRCAQSESKQPTDDVITKPWVAYHAWHSIQYFILWTFPPGSSPLTNKYLFFTS